MELYEQLLPTRVYAAYKTGTLDQINILLRMCDDKRKPCSRFGGMFIKGANWVQGQA